LLLIEDGLESGDILAVLAEEVRLFNLTGVFLESELDQLLAELAKAGLDL
jgi:hypothetical protein